MSPAEHARAVAIMAERVIQAVHDERPDDILAELAQALAVPAPAGVDPVVALVTVLAASVSPDSPMSSRLAWVRDLDAAQDEAA